MTVFLHVPLVLLALLSASFAFDGYDFVFNSDPQKSNAAPRALLMKTNDIRLSAIPKTAFAICFYVYLEDVSSKEVALVSYSSETSGSYNEIYFVIAFDGGNPYTALSIDGKAAIFYQVPEFGDWTHICISWKSKSGEAILFFNGKRIKGDDNYIRIGYQIGDEGYLVLGQDQDDFDGGYDPKEGVKGRMTQFKLFARELTEGEAYKVMKNELRGEVIDWHNSTFLFNGGIRIEKTTAPIYFGCGEIKKLPCQNVENTNMSPYDLENPFENGLPREVTATLKNVDIPDLKEFSICFYLYNKYQTYEFQPITYKTIEGESVITFGAGPMPARIYLEIANAVGEWKNVAFHSNALHMFCATWNSSMGELKFYDSGHEVRIFPNISKNYIIPGKGKFVISQHQTDPLNKTNPEEGFIYKISRFYMWSHQLTKEEVASFYECTGSVKGYLVDPSTSEWDVEDHGCPPYSKRSPIESSNKTDFRGNRTIPIRMATFQNSITLVKLTACFRVYSEAERPNVGSFIESYPLHIIADNGFQLKFYNIKGYFTTFPNFTIHAGTWYHVCLTWSTEGSTQLFVDGQKIASAVDIATGQVLTGFFGWTLYNNQYAPADFKDPEKGFAWKVTELNVWDYVLRDEEGSIVLGNAIQVPEGKLC